ncbi:MAG: translation initiation factor IF-2 [Lewinella sp.]|jgi:translation initiation factor IF-2|uniref:translation initiation factor IF-2 n=1 Tax=Lewinella sp. TaxID=2004506 RepID=UPI003D6B7EFB
MERRLVKIAKELNVGLSTIVDFLQAKGFDIDPKPTAKVSESMYQELLKEFQKSIAIKEKADQMVIGTRPIAKKEEEVKQEERPSTTVKPTVAAPSILRSKLAPPPAPKSQPAPVKPPVEEPVAKQEPTPAPVVEATPPTPVEPPKEEKKEEKTSSSPKLKVLGKIDLDAPRKPAKSSAPKAPPAPPKEEVVKETPAPVAEKPVAKKDDAPKVEEKPAAAKEKQPEVKASEKQKENTPPKESAEPTGEAANKDKEDKGAAPQASEDGITRAKTPELRGLKIMGKIDASKLGSGRGRGKKDNKSKDADKAKDANKKKTTTSSTDDKPKRRRTRRRVGPGEGRPSGGGGGNSGGRGGNNRGGSSRRGRDEVKEVSKKEIEDKIKATMARMAGTGKKRRQKLRRDNRERHREKAEAREQEAHNEKLQVTEFISVQELANLMDVDATDVIMTCMNVGVIVSINQRLDAEIIEIVAEEFDHEVEFISVEEVNEDEEEEIDDPADLEPRAPVVTIMGHVDHGKTSLLDYIREASVADGEAGGITQHIGAYEVRVGEEKKRITFLDTPGHEAFTAMRARGAKVTDIAVIIIAADDNIMPQTKEAISHAEAAGVPMIFAINKIDKPGASPERIKQELASMNYLIEEWGGAYGSADISAKQGTNIDLLLERILLEAEIKELKANPNKRASGAVLEASLDKGRGYVTKMLVQAGTLRVGDPMVSGEHSGRVKAMFNERNQRIKEAGPSAPVLVLGLGGAPQAGERIKVVENEQEARDIANRRAQISREQANRATKRISLDEIGRRLALGNFKELNLIVKGDVDGSVEALADSLIKLSQETVKVNVIHQAVGQIIESDVLLATASDAIIIGFQVRPSSGARKLSEREGVQIKTYSVIYEAIEEIKLAIEGMLDTIKEENILGQLEVREIFKISKVGTVAGSYVTEGKILRDNNVRLIRDGIVVYPTKEGVVAEIKALKRFKDDVKEVRAGMECGVSIKNFNDLKVGDVIEAYEIVEIKQKLTL